MNLKCSICGRFVTYKAIGDTVNHTIITPLSDFSTETWDTYHTKCTHEQVRGDQSRPLTTKREGN